MNLAVMCKESPWTQPKLFLPRHSKSHMFIMQQNQERLDLQEKWETQVEMVLMERMVSKDQKDHKDLKDQEDQKENQVYKVKQDQEEL